ncbi:hypothetical protein KCU99_g2360, partial [Aureobasidium melanogenum]
MFSEEDSKPTASGPTILDSTVARTTTGLSYAKDWSADALSHLCQAYGVPSGSIDDKEMLLAMLEKSLTQPVVYEGFELQDLTKFIEARGLSPHQSSTNTITTKSSLQGAFRLQQSDSQEKSRLNGIGHLSMKRNPKSTVPTEGLSRETRSINTSIKLNTVIDGFKAVLNGFMTVSPQEDQLAVVAPSPSEPNQTKSTLIEMLETADRNACFNFLDLPAEIRQMVYDLTCRASLPIFHPQRQPAMTKACRLTRAEALPIYYRHNRFAMIVGALHEMSQSNSWMRGIQLTHLSWIRSFAFVDLNFGEVIELDIKSHGKIRYHFKTRKLPSKKVTTQHSRNTRHNRGRRCRVGEALNRSRNAMEKFNDDGLALVLGMPNCHYIELECQLADRIQTVIDKENFEASERRARYGDVESRMSLNRSTFFPTCLPLEDWELLQREWTLAQGFSILGLRALTYALQARSFWEKRS